MPFLEFLAKYWSQVVLALGAVGYIFKQIADYRYKLQHEGRIYLLQSRASTAREFFEAYSKLAIELVALSSAFRYKNFPSVELFDEKSVGPMRDLLFKVMTLGLFHPPQMLEAVNEIYKSTGRAKAILQEQLRQYYTLGTAFVHDDTIQKTVEDIINGNGKFIEALVGSFQKNLHKGYAK